MKKITCELCGGNSFMKKDGFFICDYCQIKYTHEEAKKLMVEGAVEDKVDRSNELTNYKKLASQNYSNGNYEQAAKYYDKILEINTEDWQATFYRGICTSRLSSLAAFRIVDSALGAKDALKIIEKLDIPKEEFNKHVVYMAESINDIAVDFTNSSTNHYNEFWELESSVHEHRDRLIACLDVFDYAFYLYSLVGLVENNIKKQVAENIIHCCISICEFRKYKSGYSNGNDQYQISYLYLTVRQKFIAEYDEKVKYIKAFDDNYEPPKIERDEKPGGCYIATCVYGSYDCPEVWKLRRFRDLTLKRNYLGKLFIKIYYAISPKLVQIFGSQEWFKSLNKRWLDLFIKKLNNKYSDQPYKD